MLTASARVDGTVSGMGAPLLLVVAKAMPVIAPSGSFVAVRTAPELSRLSCW